jgi:hypothetical protein
MIDPTHVPQVASAEILARYIFQSSHLRRSTRTLKPDAFIPPRDLRFSVTRHLSATENELWSVGEDIAGATGRQLYGRGDVPASAFLAHRLATNAAPIPQNPNHAEITGWPADKPAQKIIAQEIAAAATYVAKG